MMLELPYFEHFEATTLDQAISLLREHGDEAAVIAGATDLLGLLKDKIEGPEMKIPKVLINIKPIKDLNRISENGDGYRIGATVTLTELVHNELIRKHLPILSQAAGQVGTTQLRNMATLGGNLCQRPRCMYFRHPHFLCFKKGGQKCFAVTGEHRDYHSILNHGKCVMAHPSDTAPALIALNADVVITGSDGEKTIPLQEFFASANSHHETILHPGQFLKEIRVRRTAAVTRQIFLKQRIRHTADFALASVAATAVLADGICQEINLVLGGVAPLPLVASSATEDLRGKRLDEALIAQAAESAIGGAKPLSKNRFKLDLTRALVSRALTLISQGG